MWKLLWSSLSTKIPSTLKDTLTSDHYSPKSYRSTERANSALKFIKSDRSTMGQDRLNALLLLYVHKDIVVDYEAVIDLYASRHLRRMVLVNPL